MNKSEVIEFLRVQVKKEIDYCQKRLDSNDNRLENDPFGRGYYTGRKASMKIIGASLDVLAVEVPDNE